MDSAPGLGAKCPDKSKVKPQLVTRFLAALAGRSAAAVLLALACAGSVVAQQPVLAQQDDKITVNFVNADIQSVIKTIGAHTGKNFILDPRVTGTVNIVS